MARRVLSDYAEAEDLITIGAYKEGQNAKVDYAVKNFSAIQGFLTQLPEEKVSMKDADSEMEKILG
jgi:flagellum-specific ATP synthase